MKSSDHGSTCSMAKLAARLLASLRWSDPSVQRLGRNARHLLASNALQSAFGLAASIVVARSLGVKEFGVLALITGYCAVVTQLLSFQSTYAVIEMGTGAREKGAMDVYLGVLHIGLWLDVFGAVCAACLTLLGAWMAMHWLTAFIAVSHEHLIAIAVFSIGILTGVTGAPTAILRMRDRYDAFLWHGVVSSITRLALVLLALLLDGSLLGFAIAGTAASVIANLMLVGLASREMQRERREISAARASFAATLRTYPELPRALVTTNLTATMRMVREIDILVVGYVLGDASAGVFRIARQIANLTHKLVDPFFHAIYPDLAKTNAAAGPQAMAKLAHSASLLIGTASVIVLAAFMLAGESLLVLVLGLDYATAYVPAALMLLGAAIWSFGYAFSPALMAWGAYGAVFRVTSICSVIYIVLVWLLSNALGVNGAASAYPAFYVMWVAAASVIFARQLRARGDGTERRV